MAEPMPPLAPVTTTDLPCSKRRLRSAQHDGCVVAAEAVRSAQHVGLRVSSRDEWHVIQVAGWIWLVEIERGVCPTRVHAGQSRNGLDRARGRNKVTN